MENRQLTVNNLHLDTVLKQVYTHATHMKSKIHGESHWLHVTQVGHELAQQTPDCDLAVIFLFGLLHDSKRLNDGRDPEHGERASQFAQELHQGGFLPLDNDQLEKLRYACHEHDNGLTSDDPTIGICWDADRLNLWRVGRIPKPKFMSTEYAKLHNIRMKALQTLLLPYTWQGLLKDYIALEQSR